MAHNATLSAGRRVAEIEWALSVQLAGQLCLRRPVEQTLAPVPLSPSPQRVGARGGARHLHHRACATFCSGIWRSRRQESADGECAVPVPRERGGRGRESHSGRFCQWLTALLRRDVPPDMAVVAVAAGWSHTAAVSASGELRCFGGNGCCHFDVPPGIGPVIAVAAGEYHT